MHLYLMRHGRAADRADWTAPDAERPLTDEGRERTVGVARGLAALGVAPAAVVTSPFARASETAAIVAAELGLPVELTPGLEPGANLAALASVLSAHVDDAGLLIVGHEPDFSALIAELIGGKRGARVEMKKSACACVDLPTSVVQKAAGAAQRLAGAGTLCWLLTAPQLAQLGNGREPAPAGTSNGSLGGTASVPDTGQSEVPHRPRSRKTAASGGEGGQ